MEVELQSVGRSKLLLEKELQEVIAATSQELEESREKALELEDEVMLHGRHSGGARGGPVSCLERQALVPAHE